MEICRHFCNKVSFLNKTLNKKYYSSKIQENVGTLRESWKIVNQIFNKSSLTTKIDSTRLGDEAIMIMNEYFCNVVSSLKEIVPYEKFL